MAELPLTSLHIQNFRAFRDLQIPSLGRVNLITGRNNVGKSTLLEALRVYADRGRIETLWQLLVDRDQASTIGYLRRDASSLEDVLQIVYLLFHLSQVTNPFDLQLTIADSSRSAYLNVSLQWMNSLVDSGGQRQLPLDGQEETELKPAIRVETAHTNDIIPLEKLLRPAIFRRPGSSEAGELPFNFIPAPGPTRLQVADLWDQIALTSLEEEVVAALRIIAPGVERVSVVGEGRRDERIPMVRRAGREREPLRSLGDGMNRLFGLALALVNAKDGFLLVDEIENGLHYTVHPDVWTLIFRLARRLNVQVFATTHSWDMVVAFQQAATADTEAEGRLIRLERKKNDDIRAVVFDEEELSIATREELEVR